jgi:integrase
LWVTFDPDETGHRTFEFVTHTPFFKGIDTMSLTDIAVRQAKARDRAYKLADASGLCLLVQPNGSKWWRYRYRFWGREKMLSVGVYPGTSLSQARVLAGEARKALDAGKDPGVERVIAKTTQDNTFETVGRHLLAAMEKHVHADKRAFGTFKKNRWVQEKLLFPKLGNRPVGEITPKELLTVLKDIETKGQYETARRARQRAGQIFRHAIGLGFAERDITTDLKGLLTPPIVSHHASIIDPAHVGKLIRAIYAYSGAIETRSALKLAPLLIVRPGELRNAEWEHFDFGAAEWRIPARNMKMRAPHLVPLSRQSLEILKELKEATGDGQYLFPKLGDRFRPMSENTVNKALRTMGYVREEMTGHGFRSTASTLLNEHRWDRDAIERQLAHTERSGVRAAYNYAEHLPVRRQMMQAWADYLDQLRLARPEAARSVRMGAPSSSWSQLEVANDPAA